jgi:NAD(P)-dependent dehydrogenase (short-subunit alcohol dehydrogenase family)
MNPKKPANKLAIALAFASALACAPFAAQAAFKPDAPTVLVTGANRGIGLELARQYAANGWNVIATSRRPVDDKGVAELKEIQKKHPNLHIERIDVSDTAMIRGVQQKYKDQPLDVLINNAANVEQSFQADLAKVNVPFDKIDYDAARTDFDVNTLGPMRMIKEFYPNIEKSKQKKIVNVTSFVGSYDKGGTPMGMNYGASKAALNMYTYKLHAALKGKGVVASLVQPVMVQSKPGVKDIPMSKPVEEEVAKLVKIIDGMTVESAGGKITNFSTGRTDPW